MIALFGGAAAGFALQLVANTSRDRRKQQRLQAAYRTAAAATIEHCQSQGYPASSDIWSVVTDLLRTEARAQQIASWYAGHTIDPTEFQDMTGNDPIVRQFLEHFISLLNHQRADLLPLDLQILAAILNTGFSQTSQQIEELKGDILELGEAIDQQSRSGPESRTKAYWLDRPATIGDGFVGREAELEAIGKAFEGSLAACRRFEHKVDADRACLAHEICASNPTR